MDKRPENPPAFPLMATEAACYATDGMSLRDWFAGQALAGICAALSAEKNPKGDCPFPRAFSRFNFVHASIDAYFIADAMLAERAKREGGSDA